MSLEDKLDIVDEFNHKNRCYFIDKDDNLYTTYAKLPRSPIVSYKVFNKRKYYTPIEDPNKIDELMSAYKIYKEERKND